MVFDPLLKSHQKRINKVNQDTNLCLATGQSSIGESFLMGRGPSFAPMSKTQDWTSICTLMTAPMPPLRSCLLLAPAAVAVSATDKKKPASLPATRHTYPPTSSSSGQNKPAGSSTLGSTSAAAPGVTRASSVQGTAGCVGLVKGEPAASATAFSSGAASAATDGRVAAGVPAAAASIAAPPETHLQRMLLEAMANGSVASGISVENMIK